MAVDKSFWGIGVGSAMLGAAIDWARASSVLTKLNLLVRTDNVRAFRLYQRKGFTVEGTVTRAVCIDGEYFDQHWMGLKL